MSKDRELDKIVSRYFCWTVERWHREGLADLQALIATRDAAHKQALLEAVGEDEQLDPAHFEGVPRYKDGRDMWGEDYAQNLKHAIRERNTLRQAHRYAIEQEFPEVTP